MSIALITGSAGLIGSQAVAHFAKQGLEVVGIDNNMREYFFGKDASTAWMRDRLLREINLYRHHDLDVRNYDGIKQLFERYSTSIAVVIHTAAQPSHDWAATEPRTDFSINANGTLNLLEATRLFAPDAVFIFTSTNKVYGDRPNDLPLVEQKLRWEIANDHPYWNGISEDMSIDSSLHSV